jgi:hypothetical protein
MNRMPSLTLPLVCAALPLSLCACGLVFGGSRQTIQANSSPSGAKITTAPATATLTTPASISLERKKDYSLTFSMPGYSSSDVQVVHHVRAGIVVLDILFGLVPVIVDAATGAWNGLSPNMISTTLTKTAMIDGPQTIRIGIRVQRGEDATGLSIQSSTPGVVVKVAPRN